MLCIEKKFLFSIADMYVCVRACVSVCIEPLQQVASDLAAIKKGLVLVEKELGQIPPDSNDRLKTILNVCCSAYTHAHTLLFT